MIFLTIVICLLLEHFFDINQYIKRASWFNCYAKCGQAWLNKTPLTQTYVQYAVLLLGLPIVVIVIQWLISGWWYGFFELLFSVVVLLYCLGPRNINHELPDYYDARQDEALDKAHDFCKEVLGISVVKKEGAINRAVTKAIFSQSNNSIFAVLFWFIILGPVGAALYRIISLLKENPVNGDTNGQFSASLLAILDWIPVRLMGIIFALVGEFNLTFKYWFMHLLAGLSKNEEFISNSGLAALGIEADERAKADVDENRDAVNLVNRSLIVYVVILALLTLTALIA